MAKETAKPAKKTATKRSTPAKVKASASETDQIEKVCVESLKKLQELGIEQQHNRISSGVWGVTAMT